VVSNAPSQFFHTFILLPFCRFLWLLFPNKCACAYRIANFEGMLLHFVSSLAAVKFAHKETAVMFR
jgi:hypothetical protein